LKVLEEDNQRGGYVSHVSEPEKDVRAVKVEKSWVEEVTGRGEGAGLLLCLNEKTKSASSRKGAGGRNRVTKLRE